MNYRSVLITLAAAVALAGVSACSETSNTEKPQTTVETVTETVAPTPDGTGTGDHGGSGHSDTFPTGNPAVPTSPPLTLHPTNGIITPTTLHPTDGILTPTLHPTNGILTPTTLHPTGGILPNG
ncbi:hypothetical protein [Rhodococcus sp. JT-3]|uniref:hypothetical protein n=1 Tax=Rhodococcus sp. JT-3 TaxID=1973213 RepID=UPI001303A18E|nr:hypothetical protein [Rhodococcus sp. JT-3]